MAFLSFKNEFVGAGLNSTANNVSSELDPSLPSIENGPLEQPGTNSMSGAAVSGHVQILWTKHPVDVGEHPAFVSHGISVNKAKVRVPSTLSSIVRLFAIFDGFV